MSTIAVDTQDNLHQNAHEHHFDGSKNVFGFWLYIMTDCVLFATLFSVYAVLHTHSYGGVRPRDIFSLPYILGETMILLCSSFTYGLAMLSRNSGDKNKVLRWIYVTFILGLSFVLMEIYEFHHLYTEGHSWASSAFLSSYFTLVGTHGLHVSLGLLWMASMIYQVKKHGVTPFSKTKLTCLGLFWHFLDIVWIFIFSIVYLMGVI